MKIHSLENTGSISVDGVDIISLNPNGTIQIGTQTVFTSASYVQATATGGTITNQTIGNQIINGNLIVTGSLTAQQFIVSSSVTYLTTSFASGSTKFGDTLDDVHGFTGSLSISGSLIINGASYNTTTSGTSGTNGTAGSGGTSGSSGTDGTGGTSGSSGTNGTGGTSGTNGTAGSGGTSGANGSSGDTGSSGSAGTSGINGTSGTSGTNGTAGSGGTSGADGSSGATGSSGSAGTSGTSGTATTSTRVEENFIATAGQTTFTVTGGYTVGLVDVFVNGVRFLPTEYTATNGTTVVFSSGLLVNDEVTIINYTSVIVALPTSRNVQDFTATSGQTTFTVTNGYIVGLLDVFVNGSKLTSSEFTATNGTTFVLTIASTTGDQVQSINYTASVNGVSGAGTTNELAYYTASSTLSSLTTATYPSLTELSYVKGVTSSLQTQLNAKASSSSLSGYLPLSGGTLTGALGVNNVSPTVPLDVTGDAKIGGNLTVTGNLTAQQFIVSSSVTYLTQSFASGSHKFGDSSDDNHNFTGSLIVSGSANPLKVGTNLLFVSSSGNVGIGTTSPSQKLHISDSTAVYCRIISTGGGDVYLGSETNIGVLSVSNAMALDIRTNNTTRLYITSIGAVAIGATAITDPYTATGGGWQTVQFGKGGILGAYRTDNESMTGFNTYVATDGSNKAIISSIGGSAIRYYEDRITFNTLSTSGTAQTQTERMRITSVGNVGVGITPNSGWSSFTAIQLGGNTYSAVASSNHYLNVAANSYYDGTNFKYIANGFSTRYQQSDGTHLWYIAASGTAGNTVSYSEAVRIETDGNLQINNAKGLKLFTEGNGAYWMLRTYNAASNQLRFNYAGTDLALIATVTGNYTALSDVNKKKDFEQSQIGLNEVLGLKPTLYRMKTEADTEDKHLGFIAQEVKEFIPQAYSETGEGDDKFIGLSEMPIIAALVKAVQQQQSQIEELKTLLKA